jgi:hypothetical protein
MNWLVRMTSPPTLPGHHLQRTTLFTKPLTSGLAVMLGLLVVLS